MVIGDRKHDDKTAALRPQLPKQWTYNMVQIWWSRFGSRGAAPDGRQPHRGERADDSLAVHGMCFGRLVWQCPDGHTE